MHFMINTCHMCNISHLIFYKKSELAYGIEKKNIREIGHPISTCTST